MSDTIESSYASNDRELPLYKKLAADIAAALGSGFTLSWFLTPMDAAVTENMSGRRPVKASLMSSFKEIATKPHRYARRPEFGIILGVYSGTYLAKNTVDSCCDHFKVSNETTAFIKFWSVLAVNAGLGVFWKDPNFAKIFGTKAATSVPVVSYAWWVMRDSFHMLGGVVAPDYLEKRYGWTKEQWRYAQVSFPLLVQLFTSPCHLMGLDYYNNTDSALKERLQRTAKKFVPTVSVRCVRMFPPWSIGLVANREIRQRMTSSMNQID
eukprot:CAMPEP_0202696050 /NCGR_PEP_ID=MMETSP1385-20130828/9428_1 /ASSEMBLY_ACC=CAM_ASM_000861 /TAXON_ID=933848 /ORGANISM="Elphidium margaritaceum" /LENGTH=266 /DNA_ID=CAMNT_0049352147 /DNA_START=38 /DNA_END=838 /DNA_ORIENTATION=+